MAPGVAKVHNGGVSTSCPMHTWANFPKLTSGPMQQPLAFASPPGAHTRRDISGLLLNLRAVLYGRAMHLVALFGELVTVKIAF